jgi:hypothetical protein
MQSSILLVRRSCRHSSGGSEAAATAIHVAVYNFCRTHSTIRCTPAMAAGVIDRLWGMGDLYDAVTQHAAQVAAKRKRDRRIQRLIDRLQRGE